MELHIRLLAVVCPFRSRLRTFFSPSIRKGQLSVLETHSCAFLETAGANLSKERLSFPNMAKPVEAETVPAVYPQSLMPPIEGSGV